METHDVVIVGGGPAGAACAWRLAQRGVDCVILDAQPFPRLKLCAGWVTPAVLSDVDIAPDAYPHGLVTFTRLRVHVAGLRFSLSSVQHSIRRFEFDDWLVRRAGVPLLNMDVRDIRRDNGQYIVAERFRCRHLVGAAGTKCPVYRLLFRDSNPRARELQTVTLEQELPYAWTDPDCHLWFFRQGLPGYAWYVPKANGWLNIGIGAMAAQLKARGDDIRRHWERFVAQLDRAGLVRNVALAPKGYSYYLRADMDCVQRDGALLAGDSAGLATRDLCEGIGPAVRSGLLAADAILDGTTYSLRSVARYSVEQRLVRRALEYGFVSRGRLRHAGA